MKGNSIVSFFPNRPKNRNGNQSTHNQHETPHNIKKWFQTCKANSQWRRRWLIVSSYLPQSVQVLAIFSEYKPLLWILLSYRSCLPPPRRQLATSKTTPQDCPRSLREGRLCQSQFRKTWKRNFQKLRALPNADVLFLPVYKSVRKKMHLSC